MPFKPFTKKNATKGGKTPSPYGKQPGKAAPRKGKVPFAFGKRAAGRKAGSRRS